MVRLINGDDIKEGDVFCKWMRSRLLVQNKNVLSCELGPTGSGKSYRDLRKAELWYTNYLGRPFPKENICFGVAEVMKRLRDPNLKAGDVIIFEEAGANLGSLDFQNKVSKMFTYVLQSFRSMNVAIFFNLPYLSMLNKQARLLLHYSSESAGVDQITEKNRCKPFFHQVNQSTGKVYKKYPKVFVNGRMTSCKRFNWSKPNPELVKIYEQKKKDYLNSMQTEFLQDLVKSELKKAQVLENVVYTSRQAEIMNLLKDHTQEETAKILGITQSTVSRCSNLAKKNKKEIEMVAKMITV